MRARLRLWWRALWRRGDFEREMDEEMRFHLEARADDLVRQGLSRQEAARRARLEFGAREHHKEECRQARGLRVLDELRADLRYAWRSLRRSPGASAVAVVILGLAIGVNVALFTFLEAYAFSPLPIASADRYVDVLELDERSNRSRLWTPAELAALEHATAAAFEGLYGSRSFELPMLEPGKRIVHGQAVSPSFFSLLGARLARGRAFTNDPAAAVVLSDVGWKRLLDADPGVLGRQIRLGKAWFTVVGVTAPEFRGVEPVTPELWMPLAAHAALTPRARYDLAGVLRRGVTPERAAGLGSGVVAGFERPPGSKPRLLVERRPSFLHADERGELSLVGGLVLAAFALVLLIACANLASLHLARAAARHREVAIRLSLGATRLRLVRMLLTESMLLAGIGAALGCALAVGARDAIQARVFSLVIQSGLALAPIQLHGRVFACAVVLAVVAGLAFGLLPALEATSPDLASGSRRDGLALGGRIRPQRLGGLLVTAQVAASLVLLALASLVWRNTRAATRLDEGYDAARLIALRFPDPPARALARLRQDPRVAAASAVSHVPLSGSAPRHPMLVGGTARSLRYHRVDDAYFDTLGVRLVRGRSFRLEEVAHAAPVVVVSAATARALWPGGSPLGRTLAVTEPGGPPPGRYEVIGVVPDVVSGPFFQGRDASAVYFPAAGPPQAAEILLRPRGQTAAVIEKLRDICQEIDPAVLCEPTTLREIGALWRFPFVVASIVASALGALALALTAIGLYGLVGFSVVQRVREIGVRIALGATPGAVLRLIVARAVRSVLVGLALGLPLCLLLCRAAARFFALLDALDPVALLGAPFLLAAVAATAALIPARRATTVDPLVSLRAE